SSDHSPPVSPPLFIFGEETAEVFSSTGELALKVEISGTEGEAHQVKQDIQSDGQRGKSDGLDHPIFVSEKGETLRKSIDREFDSTQESNVLVWTPETGANELEEITSDQRDPETIRVS